jgi:hypothetical protein
MPSPRRFPPPWTLEENNNACFIVRDKNGQAYPVIDIRHFLAQWNWSDKKNRITRRVRQSPCA